MAKKINNITHDATPCAQEKKLLGVRIARISTVPFFVAAQLRHQLKTLIQHGAHVTVVTSNGPELNLLQSETRINFVIINILRKISLLPDLIALITLIYFFKTSNIKIAHSTTPKAGLFTAIAAFIAGVPLRLHTYTGQPWVGMSGLLRWLSFSSDKLIGILNTRCYADSASQRDFLVREGVISGKRIFLIGKGSISGVDVNRFNNERFSKYECALKRRSIGIPINALVLIFVGRLTIEKGLRELLQAFQEIKVAINNVHLILVGPIDNESGVAGANPLIGAEYLSNLHVTGYTKNPESYLSIADILCLPSYREGFGTVVIEAAAMGIPTVGSDIYGLSDAVVHGQTGLLVPPRNVMELTSAIKLLLTDNRIRKEMGINAKKRALSMFDERLVNELVVGEYYNLLKKTC